MIDLNNWVKFFFTASVWSFVYESQVVENKILVPNLSQQNLPKAAKKLNILIRNNAPWNTI
jgi:hypothetical protein